MSMYICQFLATHVHDCPDSVPCNSHGKKTLHEVTFDDSEFKTHDEEMRVFAITTAIRMHYPDAEKIRVIVADHVNPNLN